MPFYFNLPTTSYLALQDHVSSSSHPSLATSASTNRGVLRSALKKHKRLPIASQASHLPTVLTSFNSYVAYLFTIDAGFSGRSVADEEVLTALESEVLVRWRTNLSARGPGRAALRTKVQSIEYEILFTLLVLGETHYLIARSALHTLYDASTPTNEQRLAAIQTAMKYYLELHSVLAYASSRAQQLAKEPPISDITSTTLNALASLGLAEATLIAVLKDDPYPAAVAQSRNEADKDWMFKSPEIPKVRAHLFARLCIAAADHAAKGLAMLGRSGRVVDRLRRYIEDLRRCARGKACRFLAIDAELSGKTGEGVAWLRGARQELGFAAAGEQEKSGGKGLSKLKKTFDVRREDRKVDRGAEWGMDAGRFEEGRVVDMLTVKWEKLNNTVS